MCGSCNKIKKKTTTPLHIFFFNLSAELLNKNACLGEFYMPHARLIWHPCVSDKITSARVLSQNFKPNG